MARMKLTDVSVRNIKTPPPKTQVDYWDELVGSFALRVSYNGAKSWIVQPRVLQSGVWKATRITVGRYPELSLSEAREKAQHLIALARKGEDPRQVPVQAKKELEDRSRNTFGALAESFLKKYVEREKLSPGTAVAYRRALSGPDALAWKGRPLESITRRDVRDLLDRLLDCPTGCPESRAGNRCDHQRPIEANRRLAYLKRFFGWCVERDVIEVAPTMGIRPPAKNTKRDRFLTGSEVTELWSALQKEASLFGAVLQVLLLTGQRREEVTGMRWAELVDLGGKEPRWEIPGSRTKNKLPHVVPLASPVVSILQEIDSFRRIHGSEFVFTTTGETSVSGFSRAKLRIDAAIQAARSEAGITQPMPPWTIHDLRRTVSTLMHEELGIQPHIVEAVLNHVSGARAGVAGNYNRAEYREEKRRALEAWAKHVEDLVRGESSRASNVIRLAAGTLRETA